MSAAGSATTPSTSPTTRSPVRDRDAADGDRPAEDAAEVLAGADGCELLREKTGKPERAELGGVADAAVDQQAGDARCWAATASTSPQCPKRAPPTSATSTEPAGACEHGVVQGEVVAAGALHGEGRPAQPGAGPQRPQLGREGDGAPGGLGQGRGGVSAGEVGH